MLQEAVEIKDAKITFVSLVDKAANKTTFLVAKAKDGRAQFSTIGKILKADADTHYITGLVYEPLTIDAHGNYMTEAEIKKAAYWFAKNGGKVDLQHCFESADGLTVVENYVAPCDMTIGDAPIAKGSWVITMECANPDIWDAVQKGKLTGFSMGGFGKYSRNVTELQQVTKVEKPDVEALPVAKAGKKMSKRNKTKLDEICAALSDFKNAFDEDEEAGDAEEADDKPKEPIQKGEHQVTKQETVEAINECIAKALTDVSMSESKMQAVSETNKGTPQVTETIEKAGYPPATAPASAPAQPAQGNQEIMNTVSSTVKEAVKQALTEAGLVDEQPNPNAPVTKAEIHDIVSAALEPMLKAFHMPSNLNDNGTVTKSEVHFLHGLL